MSYAELARAFLNAITDRDWDKFRALTTPDLTQQILPQSIGRLECDRETWIHQLKDTRAMIPDWRIIIQGDVIGDEKGISFYVRPPRASGKYSSHSNSHRLQDAGKAQLISFTRMST